MDVHVKLSGPVPPAQLKVARARLARQKAFLQALQDGAVRPAALYFDKSEDATPLRMPLLGEVLVFGHMLAVLYLGVRFGDLLATIQTLTINARIGKTNWSLSSRTSPG